jgi:hypothetical protein
VELPPEEGQHVFGAQTERGVPQEPRVELAQGGATREQDVGRVLRLVRRPEVAIALELIAQERIHPADEAVKDGRSPQGRETVGELLRAPRVLQPERKAFSSRR